MAVNNYRYEIDEFDPEDDIRPAEWWVHRARAEQCQKFLENFAPEEELAHKCGYLTFKRVCDVIISLIFMIVFCWLYALLAIAVKTDGTGGPVIFKQVRIGRGKTAVSKPLRSTNSERWLREPKTYYLLCLI